MLTEKDNNLLETELSNSIDENQQLQLDVIGAILQNNDVLADISEIADSECFTGYSQRIYDKLSTLINNGHAVDATLLEKHINIGKNAKDTTAFLFSLQNKAFSPTLAIQYAKVLRNDHQERKTQALLKNALAGDPKARQKLGIANLNQSNQPQIFNFISGYDGYDSKASYLIKHVIPDHSVGMVIGASGVYKSFLAISWSCHIATGKDWNNKKVKQGGVLYVVGEGGIGVPRRFKAWSEQYNNGADIPNLFRIDQPIHMAADLESSRLIETVNEIKRQTGVEIKLIVLDTLARCFAGGDENRAADMGAFISGCDHVKAITGASVLIVHHTGKDATKGARGSSTLKAACDFEYEVKRLNDHESPIKEIVLKNYKMKDDETNRDTAYTLNTRVLYIDDDGEQVTSLALNCEGYEPPEIDDMQPHDLTTNQSEVLNAIKATVDKNDSCFYQGVRDHVKRECNWDQKKLNNFKRNLNQLAEKNLISYDHDTGKIYLVTHP
ncbi:AAA family ATPase [Thalassotalea sp. Y01]|uniref:AAA family ATPase n=1 Tax=Thalassotalea sp. Y01 TaxID=2729613 RepID=UPI00145C4193|nr:AAA family ATPase [Thalassotalea sp. Y01]NMP16137.1 AAA family ATPase [Thalassotalea sp. Y01]